MERKIGEIFEYNGEWYQCVEWIGSFCEHCNLEFIKCDEKCDSDERADGKNVIFKKLEKVGEPYVYNRTTCQLYKSPIPIYATDAGYKIVRYDMIEVLLKQKQEDMEEKKIKLNQEDLTYIIGKIRCDILPKYTTYDKITEEITKLFTPVNDAKLSNLESTGKNLKPFDLEAARKGKPVCTRDGAKARIICFDAKCSTPIIALVTTDDGEEITFDYLIDGTFANSENPDNDLMMLPEKHEGWVNVYKGIDGEITIGQYPYPTREACEKVARPEDGYIYTTKVVWEE